MTNEERQQAIEWLKRRPVMMAGAKKMYALAIEALEQPEIIRCKDCRFWKKYKYFNGKPTYAPFCGFNSIFTDDNDFCSRAEKRGEADGQTD